MMKMRIRKGYLAGLLAAALVVGAAALPGAKGAIGIDPNKDCELTLDFGEIHPQYAEVNKDLGEEAKLTVNLYKVATVDAGCKFSPTTNFGFEQSFLDGISDQTTAEEYLTEAKDIVKGGLLGTPDAQKVADFWVKDAKGESTGVETKVTFDEMSDGTKLKPGLYLVVIDGFDDDYNHYEFAPYMAALPYNDYYNENGKKDDTWLYNWTVGLKPAITPLYGDLVITKYLKGYNETLGQVSFVFKVTAWDRKDTGKTNDPIYSNVVTLKYGDFSANTNDPTNGGAAGDGIQPLSKTGYKSALIKHLPAGSIVEVKEVYHAASYDKVGEKVNNISGFDVATGNFIRGNEYKGTTVRIVKRDFSAMPDPKIEFLFENDYNGKMDPSYGVINHFTMNDKGKYDLDGINGDEVDSGEYNEDSSDKDNVQTPEPPITNNAS